MTPSAGSGTSCPSVNGSPDASLLRVGVGKVFRKTTDLESPVLIMGQDKEYLLESAADPPSLYRRAYILVEEHVRGYGSRNIVTSFDVADTCLTNSHSLLLLQSSCSHSDCLSSDYGDIDEIVAHARSSSLTRPSLPPSAYMPQPFRGVSSQI